MKQISENSNDFGDNQLLKYILTGKIHQPDTTGD